LWCIGDLRGWLTTVVGRVSLDMLRARKARRENYPGNWLLEPLVEEPAEDG
jgi:RNA polymerase sigma-70 factor, ECF subfamily